MTFSPASQLCTDCGLCCDGTLFDIATFQPAEVDRLLALGFTIREDGSGVAFALPCHLLDGACCTIYDERPSKCRTFRCGLLKRLDRDEVTVAEAQDVVAKAKSLRDGAAITDADAASVQTRLARRRAVANWRDIVDPARRMKAAALYLQLVAFDRYLDLHFRNKPVNQFGDIETSER